MRGETDHKRRRCVWMEEKGHRVWGVAEKDSDLACRHGNVINAPSHAHSMINHNTHWKERKKKPFSKPWRYTAAALVYLCLRTGTWRESPPPPRSRNLTAPVNRKINILLSCSQGASATLAAPTRGLAEAVPAALATLTQGVGGLSRALTGGSAIRVRSLDLSYFTLMKR